ncbi:MAG: CobW family GTP-binding protein [Rhizobiaceae bacterium]
MEPIAATILTGFLGSGKTTLLNRLLKEPALAHTAVIINEFGEISIDHLLVERSTDGVIELSDGCLCCTVRGDLIDTLADLVDRVQTGRIPPLKRVVIETSGLADPIPVLQSLMAHPALVQSFRLDGVIATVDAVNGAAVLDRHEEAVRQVAVADRIVLTKTDITEGKEGLDELKDRIARLNPAAPLIESAGGRVDPALLFNCGLYDPDRKIADVGRWLREEAAHSHDHDHDPHHDHAAHRHDGRIRTFSLVYDGPVPRSAIETFVDILGSTEGEHLLRMKGIVETVEDRSRPLVIHGVQSLFHPPVRLPAWPDDKRGVRLVLITMDMPEDYVRRLFAAITSAPRIDTPDRAAIEANPLAIPGYKG